MTRETVLTFSQPLDARTTLTTAQLSATAVGRKLLSRVELSADRRRATLFYLENLPASTRVKVTFNADTVKDLAGRSPDGDGDSQPLLDR